MIGDEDQPDILAFNAQRNRTKGLKRLPTRGLKCPPERGRVGERDNVIHENSGLRQSFAQQCRP